ncbi:S-adenosyl-L-methionine-dependent methyltransferase [Lophiostoma macrostomum CBS 122681]|uniref:S-adenosyl-L-methionine-dependent methyltransferase n=1 Tax=Lophiostoma macrostomum CBS 122681 TaxID=1314788 RepID=A0A6A6TAH5_9PLEO|nr:S-adenosyl-L-methionine-dependent methyltransferase [Lophiostoma macrostomum CBS 122681]
MASGNRTGTASASQTTQYDSIGIKYNSMHDLPAVLPEKPSVLAALGNIKGARCLDLACGTGRYTHLLSTLGATSVTGYDISPAMIAGAQSTYPPSEYPTLSFAVADCSKPLPPQPHPYDVIFAGWFLNYAASLSQLTSMFRVIASNLAPGGRFVGITTNVLDPRMTEPKTDFYGVDVEIVEGDYVDPENGERLGIKARVVAHTQFEIRFEVYQFERGVYERAAKEAGVRLEWKVPVLPDENGGEREGEKRGEGYWDRWAERATFVIVEAVHA